MNRTPRPIERRTIMASLTRSKSPHSMTIRLAFTLVELLVVIAIIGILVALLLPAIQAAREAARRTQCANHLKQFAIATQVHADARKELPIGHQRWKHGTPGDGGDGTPKAGGWAWSAFLLPYIEETTLYDQIDFGLPLGNTADTSAAQQQNTIVCQTPISIARCPSDVLEPTLPTGLASGPARLAAQATTSYKANGGPFEDNYTDKNKGPATGAFAQERGPSRGHVKMKHITDGTSKTIAYGETCFRYSYLRPPDDVDFFSFYGAMNWNRAEAGNTYRVMSTGESRINPADSFVTLWPQVGREAFGSYHSGGAQFVYLDGSVQFINEDINHTARPWNASDPYDNANSNAGYGTFQRLLSRNDGLISQ